MAGVCCRALLCATSAPGSLHFRLRETNIPYVVTSHPRRHTPVGGAYSSGGHYPGYINMVERTGEENQNL